MLKILQASLQQYANLELTDVQAGFRKGRGTRDHIANTQWIMETPAKRVKDSILLDASIAELQERFAFQYRSMNEPCDDALYFEPTPQGRAVIVTNRAGEETTVNLELLFNAVVKGKVTK